MFTISDDQRDLVAMVAEFTADNITPHAVEWDRAHRFPADVLRKAADLGMGGIYVQESSGGSGLSRLDAVLIVEALAAGCPSTASYLSIHNMVAWMIDAYGNDEQRAQFLAPLLTMENFGSYCLTEPGAGSDAGALSTRAVRDGAGEDADYRLTGVKQFISGAGTSQTYVVLARTADTGPRGITAFVVDKDTPGVSFGPDEVKMGWNTQPTRQVILEDVRVPASARLGQEGDGFRIAMSGLNGGRLNIAASSLGGASAALAASIRYLGERHAFGGPLSRFEALQFDIADMATELEAARTFLWRAASALDAHAPDMVTLCAMAKRFVTDAGFEVANKALQLHGGYGYLAEYGVEKIVRDLRVHQILEGTNEIMRLIVSRELLGRSA
ncbi:acyl-CoA dehydrogenase family protein [Modestobacter excelsi]|uniref:acyl-CoA dehydrogenase family protein n=1 Tax=Modestobacter excelsi TaxID=2213161 RepID=UPI00110CC213|nr:acyl-CoA dehydrogenase family protein [Modestobacter excelsi]